MFRCEVRFDEEKAEQYGYTLEEIYETVDEIFEREGVPKVADGIYEDPNGESSEVTASVSLCFYHCPAVVLFCNYWNIYDPEDGDCGDLSFLLEKCKDRFPL